ncbi:tetratricopeptide repeat protein [Tellurirhabdus bombi]|uniref:tetratricopeptide repeat protein n=1 Tax=Tellurirhabdus bombi TaxID=2907205 RepID=UPI001F3524C2|nr:tetratricopeptide repeat protein [Tellurirhabdus bombi]
MKLTPEQYELIEAYLNGQLSAADQKDLEHEIQANAELAAEMQTQRDLRVGLRTITIQNRVQAALKRYKERKSAENKPPVIPLNSQPKARSIDYRRWLTAASAVLILGFSTIWIWHQQEKRANSALLDNYMPDAAAFDTKNFPSALNQTSKNDLQKGLQSYRKGNYDEAIGQLRKLSPDRSTSSVVNYYLGLSHLSRGETNKAILYLEKASNSPQAQIRQKAIWYLAMAHLKSGNKAKAKPILERVRRDATNPFYKQANSLWDKLF